jgi:hypothetical protein
VGWRVASAWALLGFASQCFLAVFKNLNLVEGIERALVHYLAWGIAGFALGTVIERIIESSFRDDVDTGSDDAIPS